MNRTLGLYFFGFLMVALALVFPSLSWLSPLTFLLGLPLGAIWIWRSQGRSLLDLGFRFSSGWIRQLAIGLLFGLAVPILFQAIQVVAGWITLTPRGEPIQNLASYLPMLLLRMVLIVAIEEFVFRGFFLNALNQKMQIQSAVIFSAVLWGAGHLSSMVNEGLSLGAIILGMATFLAWGIALSIAYLKLESSLWLPYGLHLGVNLNFSLLGWFFSAQPNASRWLLGHPSWSPETGLVGVTVWSLLALVVYWLTGMEKVNRFAIGRNMTKTANPNEIKPKTLGS